jgi:pilus assembly protein Flp/PilA
MKHINALLVVAYMHIADLRDSAKDRGATATEYALLVAFIAIAIVGAVTLFGSALDGFFGRITAKVSGWAP